MHKWIGDIRSNNPEQWSTDPGFRERHERLEKGDPEAIFAYCVGVAREYSSHPGSDSFQPEEYAINWLKIGRSYLDQSRQQLTSAPSNQERDIALPSHQESTLTPEQLNSTAHIASLSPAAIEAGIDSGAITNPKALLLFILNGDERTRASLKRPGETEGQFKKRFAALAD